MAANSRSSFSLGVLIATYGFLMATMVAGYDATSLNRMICDSLSGLVEEQRNICRTRPDAMLAIARGAENAVNECQWQFRRQRWNCSLSANSTSLELGDSFRLGSRETGFATALKAAAIAHSIVESCGQGTMSGCGCDHSQPGETTERWEWRGCSIDVGIGLELSRTFTQAAHHNEQDSPRSMMDLHNSRAGRKMLLKKVDTTCKCHGASASCAVKTCWQSFPTLRSVGSRLVKRYEAAEKIPPADLRKLHDRFYHGVKKDNTTDLPSKSEIVFVDDSPTYCDRDASTDSPGTRGRACNKSLSHDSDSCDMMCCGRGYRTTQLSLSSNCRCRFHWCCYVLCEECVETRYVHTCR